MNKSKLFLSTALSCTFLCMLANAADISANTARMQAMDKITGKVSEIDVPVNGLANFGTFSILVRKCVTRSAEETPENTAFIDIVDNYQTENPINIFKGWMFSSTPALNAVEHPIYDVWLLKCYNVEAAKYKTLSEEQLALRDTLPMSRPQKIDVSTSMEPVNDTEQADSQTKPQNADDTTGSVVNLDIDNIANAEEIKAETDDDFVAEDEQPTEIETEANDSENAQSAETSTETPENDSLPVEQKTPDTANITEEL